jgi:rubrerythrin
MIFLLRSSAAFKGTVRLQQKWLRANCAEVRAQWVEQFGPLKSRSLRMPIVQSAMRRLSSKYARQLHLFVTQNSQGCDVVISGFDGFLTNLPGLEAIFKAEPDQPELGLIVYQSKKDSFTRVDIQKIIQVWDRSMDKNTLDDFSQQFLTEVQQAAHIREDLSIIHTLRALGFPRRNNISPTQTRAQSLTMHWGCPLCPTQFIAHIGADRHMDLCHPNSTAELLDLKSAVGQIKPLKRWICPICDKQFKAWSQCVIHAKSHSAPAQKPEQPPQRIMSYAQVTLEWACPVCNTTFRRSDGCRQHIRKCHKDHLQQPVRLDPPVTREEYRDWVCPVCFALYTDEWACNQHIRSAHEDTSAKAAFLYPNGTHLFRCPVCLNKTYLGRHGARRHIRGEHRLLQLEPLRIVQDEPLTFMGIPVVKTQAELLSTL